MLKPKNCFGLVMVCAADEAAIAIVSANATNAERVVGLCIREASVETGVTRPETGWERADAPGRGARRRHGVEDAAGVGIAYLIGAPIGGGPAPRAPAGGAGA